MKKVISVSEVKRCVEEKGLFCWGCGQAFQWLLQCLQETHHEWLKNIHFIVDTNRAKQGTFLHIDGISISIISPEELRVRYTGEMPVVTVGRKYRGEVINFLDTEAEYIPYAPWSYEKMLAMCLENEAFSDSIAAHFRQYEKPVIPKIIHYFWVGGAPIPQEFQNYIETWKKYCPDYEIVRWDESNYDFSKNRYMMQAYKAKKWGFVPDYARLDVIYQYGGIYLDTDVELIRPLDPLLYQDGFAGFSPDGYVSLGLGFGGRKGLSILKEMCDEYDDMEFIDFTTKAEQCEKNIQASPEIQMKTLGRHGVVKNGFHLQEIENLTLYPVPVLHGMVNEVSIRSDIAFAIHHYAGTWVPKM
jgi:hypothetical protein